MTARSRRRSLLQTMASADMLDILRAKDNKDLVDINAVRIELDNLSKHRPFSSYDLVTNLINIDQDNVVETI